MKNRTFKSILNELREYYSEAIVSFVEMRAALNHAQEEWDRVRNNPNSSAWEMKTTEGQYLKAQSDYDINSKALRADLQSKVSALKAVYDKGIDNYYGLDSAKYDKSIVDMFEKGIATPSDIKPLINRYEDNMTMRRVISYYAYKMADNKFMSDKERMALKGLAIQAKRNTTGQNEIDAFEGIVSLGDKCLSDKSSERHAGQKMFNELSEKCTNSVSDTAIAESIAIAD